MTAFTDVNRNVFEYPSWDEPVHPRFADPGRVLRLFDECLGGNSDAVVAAANGSDAVAASQARSQLIEATRIAFELPHFDVVTGYGPTEEYLDWLRETFTEHCNQQKKNGPGSLTAWPATVATSAPTPMKSNGCSGC